MEDGAKAYDAFGTVLLVHSRAWTLQNSDTSVGAAVVCDLGVAHLDVGISDLERFGEKIPLN